MVRSMAGTREASVNPRAIRSALTRSTIGPSLMPRPSSVMVARVDGSPFSAPISCVWLVRSVWSQVAANACDVIT